MNETTLPEGEPSSTPAADRAEALQARLNLLRAAINPRLAVALTSVLLAASVVLAVVMRIDHVSEHTGDTGYNQIVMTYTSLSLNVKDGNGYYTTASSELDAVTDGSDKTLPVSEYAKYPKAGPFRPISYYTPGYAYLNAAVWTVVGEESHISAQYFQAVFNGIVGTICVFVILNAAGQTVAGLIAALAYAVSRALLDSTSLFLPDAYSTSVLLVPAALLALGYQLRRLLPAAILAGLTLGAVVWLRAEAVAVMPLFLIAIVLFSVGDRKARLICGGAFVAFWMIPLIGMGLFNQNVYGEFQPTRPGAGVRLWEGIGQQGNPWGIAPVPGGSLDNAAGALLEEHGLEYGDWTGDRFLLRTAIEHMLERPMWFVGPTLERLQRVSTLTSFGRGGEAYYRLPVNLAGREISVMVLLPLALAGAYLLRSKPFFAVTISALALSTILPFAFLLDEIRNTVTSAPGLIMLGSVAVYHLLKAFCESGYQMVLEGLRRWPVLPAPAIVAPAVVLSIALLAWWGFVAVGVLVRTRP